MFNFFFKFFFSLVFFFFVLDSKTVAIRLVGEVNPSLHKYLKRAVFDAKKHNPDQIVIIINTFGGELNTTFKIVELFSSIDYPTISLVEDKAISAGTLIALSSKKLYMMSNTIMGDVAPVTMGAQGPKMLGEKFQSPLRAKFRALAQKNGYPVKMTEAFVSSEKEIIEITWENGDKTIVDSVEYEDLIADPKNKILKKKTLVPKGELLTMSEKEAIDFGFSSGTVASIEALVKEIEGGELIIIEKTSAEKTFTLVSKYAWVLILVGLGGIYLEVKTPGFGFYGFTAIAAFFFFFISQYIVELANIKELALLVMALCLLVVEVFIIPGFGIFGFLGIALLLSSFILMMQPFTIPENVFEWDLLQTNANMVLYIFLASLILFVLMLYFNTKFMYRSPLVFRKNLFEKKDNGYNVNDYDYEKKKNMIGKIGVTETKLSPSGKVIIDDEFYDALVESDFLANNEKVKVIGVQGYSLVVERCS